MAEATHDASVMADLTTVGWYGGTPEQEPLAALLEPVRLADAMWSEYQTDAMFSPVVIPGEAANPRLTVAGAARLVAAGVEPLLTWAVIDLDRSGHSPWDVPGEAALALQAAVAAAAAVVGNAPYGYTSRAGLRLLWPLAEPVPVTQAESFLSQLHTRLRPAVPQGLALDSTCDQWHRVYRLPFVRRDGVLLRAKVQRGETLHWRPPTLAAAPLRGSRRGARDDLPEPRALTPEEWMHIPSKWRAPLRAGQEMFQAHGDPGHDVGTMCVLLPRLCAAVARVEEPSPELVYQAVRASVEAQGWPPLDRVWDRIQDFAETDRETFALERSINRALMSAAYSQGQSKADEIRENIAPVVDREEVKRAAQEQAADGTPPLVYTGDTRTAYVYYPEDGVYRSKAKDVIAPLLEKLHGLDMRTSKGGWLPFTTIFDMVGSDAHEVRVRYWRPGMTETFDPRLRALLRTTPRPDHDPQPCYHADVAKWLSLLPEDPAMRPRVLDWVQAAMDVDNPIAALLLVGAPGAGKSLLAEGIGAVWGGAGNANSVFGADFAPAIGETPVLLADEGFRASNTNHVESFKSMVTARRHELKLKHVNNTYIYGCVRLIVAANKDDDVAITADLTPESMAALEERILYVKCSEAAGQYLASIQADVAATWVRGPSGEPGKVAQHAMWLAANRELSMPPGRLLVYGETHGKWRHQRLVNADGLGGAVLVALAQWASMGAALSGLGVHPEHPGIVFVNSGALHQHWHDLTRDKQAPRLRSLAMALGTLATSSKALQMTIGGVRARYFTLPVDLIMATAYNCGIGDESRMRAWLAGPTAPQAPSENRPTEGTR